MNSKRLVWADSIKGVLILLVVLGHAIQNTIGHACYSNHLWNFIYSFHMPAFMAISGYLAYRSYNHSGGGFIHLVWRRFRQLTIPFFLWTFLLLLSNDNLSLKSFGDYLIDPDKGLWFLWVLYFINVLFLSGEWLAYRRRISEDIVILSHCLILGVIMIRFDLKPFGFGFIAYYYMFYSIGYYMHKFGNSLLKNRLVISALIIVWALMAWFWNMHELPVYLRTNLFPNTLVQYAYRFITAGIAVYVLLILSSKFLNGSQNWNKALVRLGYVSLGIYTTHFIVLGRITGFLKDIGVNSVIVIFLSFIVGVFLSWLIVWLLNKWKVTAQLLLGKL